MNCTSTFTLLGVLNSASVMICIQYMPGSTSNDKTYSCPITGASITACCHWCLGPFSITSKRMSDKVFPSLSVYSCIIPFDSITQLSASIKNTSMLFVDTGNCSIVNTTSVGISVKSAPDIGIPYNCPVS